jgi:hypothetical protein
MGNPVTSDATRAPARNAKNKKISHTSATYKDWVQTAPQESSANQQVVPQDAPTARTLLATSAQLSYIHAYINYRPKVDWNTCGQAAMGTLLDFHNLDPYHLARTVVDGQDNQNHWFDGDIIDALKADGLDSDNPFGLGMTVFRVRDGLRKWGLRADAAYSGFLYQGWQSLWDSLQQYVAAGIPVPVLIHLGDIGGPMFTAHWPIVYRIDGGMVYLGNCGWAPQVAVDQFLVAWQCRFLPYTYNHCGVFVQA